jgi:hypothetical protein
MKASLKLLFIVVLFASALRWPTVAKAGEQQYKCTEQEGPCQSACEAPMGECTEYCQNNDEYTTYYIEDCTGAPPETSCDYEQYYALDSSCMNQCVETLNNCISSCLSEYCTPIN